MKKPQIFYKGLSILCLFAFALAACAPAATQAPASTQAPAATEAPAMTESPAATEAPTTAAPVTLNFIDLPKSK